MMGERLTIFMVEWQVTEDEVEIWILKAITAKLLDCKMDQMNQIVLVR